MATEAHKFQVGVFVIAAVLLGVGTAIWLGASRFFEETVTYVTYFSESVQGLDPGSAVKYRGVPAGRVARIGLAPDGNLIEVVMDIDTSIARVLHGDPTLRAQLELSGITGLRYLEIDRHSGAALNESPPLTFQPTHELLPSCRSSFKAIQQALEDVYDKIMGVDLMGVANDTRTMLHSANALLQDEGVHQTIANMRTLSASAATVTKNLEAITGDLKLAPAVNNLTVASAEVKALASELRGGPLGPDLRDALRHIGEAAQSAQQFVAGLQQTTDRLDRTIGNMERLTDDVRNQPSRLLFSSPPEARQPADRSQP